MPDARLQHVDDDEPDDQREGRDDLEVDERPQADPADLFMSPIFAMPTTTVAKMIGAIIILISLMKPSPSGFIAAPRAG